jgi:phosphate transport system protein
MPGIFESRLADLRETLLLMASIAGHNLLLAVRALVERSNEIAAQVEEEDREVDRLELLVDDKVASYIATRAPVATECRFILCVSRICSDLERVGDQATTIARRALELNQEPPLVIAPELTTIADLAQEMLNDGITAFVEGDANLAVEIVARDRMVDELHRELAAGLTQQMMADPKRVTRCLHLMTVVKCLERVGDHAANIAEEVFYLNRGEDIRHASPGRA